MVDNVTCRQSSSILLMLSCIQTKSLCWINLGDGEKALLDAEFCRMMHPDWPKACYRQGAAHMLLKVRQNIITHSSMLYSCCCGESILSDDTANILSSEL
jgi:hypothetical protein